MEPAPEPAPVLSPDLPMSQWSAAETARWVVCALELPEHGEAAAALRDELNAHEFDGEELESISVKQLQLVLGSVGVATPRGAAATLAKARDAALASSPVPAAVPEAPTPLSERWVAVLASAGPNRRLRLQTLLDTWRPQRWVIDEQELGRGSSGAVFRSTDNRLGEVAIKFSHSDQPRKLEREAALMQRVAHEHVCRLYEYHISEDGQLFGMMLELLEKGSLAQRVKEAGGRLREFEVVSMAFDVLSALE